MELRGPFDGFVEKAVRVTTTCLIMADQIGYSVDARAGVKWCWWLSMPSGSRCCWAMRSLLDDPRLFWRSSPSTSWHVSLGSRSNPGCCATALPSRTGTCRRAGPGRGKLKSHVDGDRQFVKVLGAAPDHGLAVEAGTRRGPAGASPAADVTLHGARRRLQPTSPPASPRRCAAPEDRAGGRLQPLRQHKVGRRWNADEILEAMSQAQTRWHARQLR